MSDFQLSNDVDKEKTFLVNLSEIGGRLDPYYYKSEFIDLIKSLNKNNKTKTLRDLKVIIRKGIFDISPSKYMNDGIPFLRVADIKDGSINFKNTVYLDTETHKNEIKTEYSPGDLVISKVGTLGEVSILPDTFDKYNISQNVIGLKLSNDTKKTISTKFLQIYFRTELGKKQLERESAFGVQPKITLDALRNIEVPIFSLEHQNTIIEKFSLANRSKQQKETKAKELLASIDDYLLKELGISLPEKDNSLDNRIFTTSSREISGGRFDPIFYSDKIQFLQKSKYQYRNLRECVSGFNSGFGIGKNEQDKNGDGIIQIRPTNIDNDGNLKFEKNILVPFEIVSDNNRLVYGDIIFNNTNSQTLVGKTAIFLSEIPIATYSNHITILKTKEDVAFSFYIKELLNLFQRHKFFYSICTNWNNQSGIGTELLKKIAIPLPILDKQKEIANHILEIRAKAKQLELDAQEVLDKAKQEVEQMILGAK